MLSTRVWVDNSIHWQSETKGGQIEHCDGMLAVGCCSSVRLATVYLLCFSVLMLPRDILPHCLKYLNICKRLHLNDQSI